MNINPRLISIFDSTLRDGEQAPGNAMTPQQKLAIACALEAVGVSTVEAGFPSSSPSDFEAIRLISRTLKSARFASLSRAARADVRIAAEAGGVDNHAIEIMAVGSDIHLEHKRGITRAEGRAEVADAISYAISVGFADPIMAIEDATRGTDDLLRPLCEAGVEAGATMIVLADTTGCMLPAEFGDLVTRTRQWVGDEVLISAHCHDDMGLSLSNTLAALEAGADEVQVTLAGIGERAGNAALEELAAVLTYKGTGLGLACGVKTTGLADAYDRLVDAIGPVAARAKSVFGANAFSTQAGIHQAGLLRNPITYEYVEPEMFGRSRRILVGRHSGRNVVRHVIENLGLQPAAHSTLVEDVYRDYVADRVGGECITVEALRAIILDRLEGAAVS